MSDVNVKECLRVWRREYGEQKTGKAHGQTYWRIPIQNRRHLIILFLRWMRARGLGIERFKTSSFQNDLIDICFGNAPAFDEKKRKRGHDALKEELEDILATEGIFTGKRRRSHKNSKPMPVQAPVEAPKTVPSTPKFIGTDIQDSARDSEPSEVHLDEDFAELLGVKKDDLG